MFDIFNFQMDIIDQPYQQLSRLVFEVLQASIIELVNHYRKKSALQYI